MTARLITIPFSHYCEKARWALDRVGAPYAEEGHLPILHTRHARRAGGRRTVPVLVDEGGAAVPDSTDIVAWADARAPGALLPADPAARAEALGIEDDLDLHLGPATRRWAYFYILPRRELTPLMLAGVPRWERAAFRAAAPLARRLLARGLGLDAARVERAAARIDAAFERIGALLADGRRYLAGDRFSVADLTFAALSAPVIYPPGYPVRLPDPAQLSEAAQERIAAWRATPAGRFALRLYETERGRPAA